MLESLSASILAFFPKASPIIVLQDLEASITLFVRQCSILVAVFQPS